MTDSKTPADPALDALNLLTDVARGYAFSTYEQDMELKATIRAALADRITPQEAKQILGVDTLGTGGLRRLTPHLYARLGKIAEQDQ
jgi:hypothetical protein